MRNFESPFVLAAASETEAELMVHGQIGASWWDDESVTAKDVSKQLKALPKTVKTITVKINSFGGSLADGFAIYNALKAHAAKKIVVVDGVAMSAASLIAMAGDEIRMPVASILMIHAPSMGAHGNAVELRKAAAVLDKFSDAMVGAYTAKTGKTTEEIKALLDGEDHFFTGAEAVAAGFADTLVGDSATASLSSKAAPLWAAQVSAAFNAGLKPPKAQEPIVTEPTSQNTTEVAALRAELDALKASAAESAAAIQAARDEAVAAKAQRDLEVENREVAAAVSAAESAYKHLGVKADSLGPALRKIRKTDAGAADVIENALKGADALVAQGLDPKGRSVQTGGSALEQFEALVKATMVADTKLSREKAESVVFNQNPSLYTALRAEQG